MSNNPFLHVLNGYTEKHMGLKFADKVVFGMTVLDFEVPHEIAPEIQKYTLPYYRTCYHYIAWKTGHYVKPLTIKPKKTVFSVPICYHYFAIKQNEYNHIIQMSIDKTIKKKFRGRTGEFGICPHYVAISEIQLSKYICPKITGLWMAEIVKSIRKSKYKVNRSIPIIPNDQKRPFLLDPPDKIVDNYITIEFQ